MRHSWLYSMDPSGETPLTRAEKSGYRILAEILVRLEREHQYPVDEQVQNLHEAAYWGLSGAARMLLDDGADPGEINDQGDTPLLNAVRNGHKDTVQLLIERGADINASNDMGLTALHWVALNGREDIAKTLLDEGIDLNARAEAAGGLTPRAMALLMGYDGLVELFGQSGGVC